MTVPHKDLDYKFKRNFDFIPYVEPSQTKFLRKETDKLRKEHDTLVVHGDIDNNRAFKQYGPDRSKMSHT